jgi:hypothetical protein
MHLWYYAVCVKLAVSAAPVRGEFEEKLQQEKREETEGFSLLALLPHVQKSWLISETVPWASNGRRTKPFSWPYRLENRGYVLWEFLQFSLGQKVVFGVNYLKNESVRWTGDAGRFPWSVTSISAYPKHRNLSALWEEPFGRE